MKERKIVIMGGGMVAGRSSCQEHIAKRLLDQGVDLTVVSLDEAKHLGMLDNGSKIDFKSSDHFIINEPIYPKDHLTEIKSRISRQAGTIRKQLVEVPKVHKNTNRTPKKKKRK